MKFLVFGKSGQVGRELAQLKNVKALSRADANLTDIEACCAKIAKSDADAVINAAAYTAVDNAEEEEKLANLINGEAPAAMARAAAERGIPFVHISTDYVFDGQGEKAWAVGDPIAPINAYGRSKALGEKGVKKAGGAYAILRTSWVFSAHGKNFVKTMLYHGKNNEKLTIVDDQIGGPSAACDIADACIQIATALAQDADKSGIYHFSGTPDCSWAEFAREIFKQADIDCRVIPILSEQYPTPAARPKNSRLDFHLTKKTFGIAQPDWRDSLKEVISKLD